MNRKNYDQAKSYALYLLSYRARSQQEIRDRLLKKGYSNDIANQVIGQLSELNYLNDPRFAELWVQSRIKNNPRGRFLIIKELADKGINRTTITEVVDKLLTEEIEINMGKTLAQKWLRKHQTDDNLTLKLKRYLQKKGFSIHLFAPIFSELNLP